MVIFSSMEVKQFAVFLVDEKKNEEYGESVTPKVEWESELEMKICESPKEYNYCEYAGLYEDHTIKEELVLGPEVIQEICTKNLDSISPHTPATTLGNPTKYKCDLCFKEFTSYKSRNEHKDQSCPMIPRQYIPTSYSFGNTDTNMECPVKDIKSVDPLKIVNQKETDKVCSICQKKHSKKDCLKQSNKVTKKEKKRKHTRSQDEKLLKASLDDKSKCDKKEENLEKEILVLVVAYTCEFCKLVFNEKKSQKRHLKNVCVNNPKNINKLFNCDECQKTFKVKKRLISHIRLYHCVKKSNKYQCYYCKKEYLSLNYCQNHIKIKHMNSKKLKAKCDLCLKEFSNKKYRDFHVLHYCLMSKNNIVKPVVCTLCKKEFPNQMYLGHHIENQCPYTTIISSSTSKTNYD